MKIFMINVVCGIRSTGRICTDIAVALEAQGHEVKIAYGREEVPEKFQKYGVKIGTNLDFRLHGLKARLFDGGGFGSKKATVKLIEWIKEYNPDVIHLHNIHGYYINIVVLFDYLRNCGKKIIWTLHDCWAFTGHAAYCESANCERWITGCYDCPKKDDYPKSYIDRSYRNWMVKRTLIDKIPDLQIITPSEWLASLVKKSFLAQYPVSIIYNGVDTTVFKPTASNVKEELGIKNRKMVLGVSALWEKRKGLDDFIRLSEILDKEYRIVMIGVSNEQAYVLPKKIIAIERTNSAKQLAELYTAADVYLNLTYEDNYPTTNLEAIACGTPVITYNTGGSVESAGMYGAIVNKGDINGICRQIYKIKDIPMREAVDVNNSNMILEYLKIYSCIYQQ